MWQPSPKLHNIPILWGWTTNCENSWVQSIKTCLAIPGNITSQIQQKPYGSARKWVKQGLCKGKLINAWGFGGEVKVHSKLL
jgi:hypothetical protein